MTPLYFGTRQRRLFGIYDPAHSTGRTARAAVICQPWGGEQIHAHRTLRQLATRLSQEGFHVLRFDYYGTGDSAGDDCVNDFQGSRSDVETAMAELKDIAGVAKLTLVGLRLGACLAANVASARRDEVDALVLWDPIASAPSAAGRTGDEGLDEVPQNFASTDLSSLATSLPSRTLVLMTQGEYAEVSGPLTIEHVASAPPWIEERMLTGAIPANALQHIAHWLR